MKILKILGVIILVIVLILIGIIAFGPTDAHVERQITINAPSEAVYAEVSNMKAFNQWSPWFALDENARYEWEGSYTGVGAKLIWYSDDPDVGNGSMKIIEEGEGGVKYEMVFDEDNDGDLSNNEENPAYAEMILTQAGEGTEVLWTFDADNFTGFYKIFGLLMDSFLGPMYEQGLASLKERVEGRPQWTVKVSMEDVDPVTFLGARVTTPNTPMDISAKMGEAYGMVMGALSSNGLSMEGKPLALYESYDENSITMVCGIPVADGTTVGDENLLVMQSHDGQALRAVHYGDYQLLEGTHEQIIQYADFYGFNYGTPWEVYITDPMQETDTTKWLTEVYYPLK